MRIEGKIISITSAVGLVVVLALLNGCKKSEPTTNVTTITTNQEIAKTETPSETTAVVAVEIEQTMCPVMEAPIDKDIYVEFRGKKVYFCCDGCQQKFMEEPEKYLDKLPQFQK